VNKVKAIFSDPDRYDFFDLYGPYNWISRTEIDSMLRLSKSSSNENALDVACGTGRISERLASEGMNVYCVDVSPEMIRVLQNKIRSGRFPSIYGLCLAEATKIPFKTGYFDLITCRGLMNYYPLEYMERVLKEMKGMLKDRGRIVFDISDIDNPLSQKGRELGMKTGKEIFLYPLSTIEGKIQSLDLIIEDKSEVDMGMEYLLRKSL